MTIADRTWDDLPSDIHARIMAATAHAAVRSIEKRPAPDPECPNGRWDVNALAGDRFVHMTLGVREDGSVSEETRTFLTSEILDVSFAPDGAATVTVPGPSGPESVAIPASIGPALDRPDCADGDGLGDRHQDLKNRSPSGASRSHHRSWADIASGIPPRAHPAGAPSRVTAAGRRRALDTDFVGENTDCETYGERIEA